MPETEPVWEAGFEVETAGQLQAVAAAMAADLRRGDLLILSGGLGAGKTTFAQGLGKGLGVRAGIISPTFVLVRIHPALDGGPALVHADVYRLGSAADIDDLDLESTMDSAVTVVEWGAGRVEHLAESRLEITLVRPTGGAQPDQTPAVVVPGFEDDDDEPRQVRMKAFGPRWAGVNLSGIPLD